MDVPKDTGELRRWMVQSWHNYGKTFSVFTPGDQPAPDIWEPDPPGYDDKGKLHPNLIKHCLYNARAQQSAHKEF